MKYFLILVLVFLTPIMVSHSAAGDDETLQPGTFKANLKVFKRAPANTEWNHFVTFHKQETLT